MLRLTTFLISHFSEKARWALDSAGISYEERRLLPGLHMLVTRRLAKRSSVPILEHDGRVIQGSGKIIDYLIEVFGASHLIPKGSAAEARELEALADHAFGVGVQRIGYSTILSHRRIVIDLWSLRGPAWAKPLYALLYPVMVPAITRMYGIHPESIARAKARFGDAVARFDRVLATQPYLGGDTPSRVDLTVAALLSPCVAPPEHVVEWPMVPELAAFLAEFDHSRTFQHVRALYRDHRRTSWRQPKGASG